jgi:streptogrisin C
MDRRIFTTTAAVIAAAAGLTAAMTIPALAKPLAETPESVNPQVFAALQRDLKLDPNGVRVRLANEEKASRTQLTLRKSLGSTYAGSWLSGDAATLTIAVTDTASADKVRAAGATPTLVKRSHADLDRVMADLDAALAAGASVPGWYVDEATNSVVVLARDTTAAAAFVKSAGVPADAVRIEASHEDPRPFIDVIGGNAYFIGSGSRCSVGFSVNGGFVTAGHCGSTGASTSQPSGTFRGSSFPGNDYAWVQVAAGNTPRPLVNNYSGGTVSVAGSTEAGIGASVCRSGSTTGWRCGTIQARNASVTYPQGTVNGLIRTSVCAEPGDSGGSLLAGNQAQGVTSGGSGNCSSGGTTFFQPVNEILQVYGLQLLTGGGGTNPPTTPPATGCTGHEFRVTGSLASGGNQYQPNGSYYYSGSSGAHRANLCGPAGTDFDLYLQRWNGIGWASVASSTSPGNLEAVSYSGTAGYYRYRVHAYSGSGAYSLGYSNP